MPSRVAALATPYRRAVAALVVLTLGWRAWTVSRWTWQDDDWLFIERSASMPLLSYLFQDYNSHVMPGGLLVTKVMVDLSPLNFSLVVAVVAMACAASVALWGRLFERLTPGRMVALLPLAVLAFSPVSLRPMMWWACAVTALPLQICMAAMALIAVSYVERRRTRDLYRLAATFLVGLFFWEKVVFASVPTAVVLLTVARGGLRARLRVIARPVALIFATSVLYLAFFLYWTRGASSSNSVETTFAGQTLGSALHDYGRGLGQMFFPALLGGPWGTMRVDGDPYSHQPEAVTVAVLTLLLVAVVGLALRKPSLLWLVPVPVAYVVLTVGLVLFSSRLDEVWDVVLVDRYYMDGIAVAMLTVVLVLRDLDPVVPPGIAHSARARRLQVLATSLVAVSLLAGNALSADRVGVRPARDWVDNLRTDIAYASPQPSPDEPMVVWDAYAPEDVMPWAFWADHGLLSRMLSPYGSSIRFGIAAPVLYRVSETGHLEEVAVNPAVSAIPGPVEGCGYALGAGEERRIRMSGELYSWNWAIQVNAFSSEGADLVVDLGDHQVPVPMPAGLESRKVQIEGAVPRTITIRSVSPSGTACISDLFAGSVIGAG